MKIRICIAVLLVLLIALSSVLIRRAFAQEATFSSSVPVLSAEEKLHALASTRFHFIALKRFHSALFSAAQKEHAIPKSEAQFLNTGLNTFLNSAGRETMLLEALRQNRSIRLEFSIPVEEEDEFEMFNHPTKALAYRLAPRVHKIQTVIRIRPLLDQPVAFKINLERSQENFLYDVDWWGTIVRRSVKNPSPLESYLKTVQLARRVESSV